MHPEWFPPLPRLQSAEEQTVHRAAASPELAHGSPKEGRYINLAWWLKPSCTAHPNTHTKPSYIVHPKDKVGTVTQHNPPVTQHSLNTQPTQLHSPPQALLQCNQLTLCPAAWADCRETHNGTTMRKLTPVHIQAYTLLAHYVQIILFNLTLKGVSSTSQLWWMLKNHVLYLCSLIVIM